MRRYYPFLWRELPCLRESEREPTPTKPCRFHAPTLAAYT